MGFKSFPDRTLIEFGPGITGIVGPNGSGKSNVTEAIRWVLGEQSARALRGGRMEDVIFAGTQTRKPLGIAEVSLTFDNTSRLLPIDFSEVTVTRRIDRSGEGEYAINGAPCRLKDVLDLFADTGLGRDGYFSVGQGRIDEVLSHRPEDRRGLFEEAAGIVRYKVRKREALRKLEETEAALARVGDVLAELSSQAAQLGAQAERARQYLAYRDECQALELKGLLAAIAAAEANLERIRGELVACRDAQAALAAQVAVAEAAQEQDRAQLQELEGEVGGLQARLLELSDRRSRAEGQRDVSRERAAAVARQIERAAQEEADLRARLARLEAEREQTAARRAEIEAETARLAAEADAAEAAAAQAASAMAAAEENAEQIRKRAAEIARRIADREGWLGSGERGSGETHARLERSRGELAKVNAERAQAEAAWQEARDRLDALDTARDRLVGAWEQAKVAREAQVQKLAAAERRERQAQADLAAAESRLRVLSDLHRDREGFQRGVRALLQAAEHDPDLRRGLIGVVAELLSAPRELEHAIETALGPALQNVVTAAAADAQRAIQWLKTTGAGRVTFLPLDTVRPNLPRPGEWQGLDAPGVIGPALGLVRFDDSIRPAIAFLLGRTVVCKDLRAALALGRRNEFRFRVVTIDGELVNAGGSITGGASIRPGRREESLAARQTAAAREPGARAGIAIGSDEREGGLLARERQRQELAARVEELRGALEAAVADLEAAKAELRRLDQVLGQSREELHRLEVQRAELDKDRTRHFEEVARLGELAGRLQLEQVELAAQLAGGSRLAEQWRRELASLQAEAAEADARLADAVATSRAAAERRDAALAAATAAKVALASARQALAGVDADEARHAAERGELNDLLELNRAERERLAAEMRAHEAEVSRLAGQVESLGGEVRELTEELERRQAGRQALAAATTRRERELKALRRQTAELGERIGALEREEARLDAQVASADERLRHEFGCDRAGAAERAARAPEVLDADARIAELRLLMDGLEPVNLAAVDDYAAACERRDFLAAQQADLEAAKDALHRAIGDLDQRMRQRFEGAFSAIRAEFQQLFTRFFGGGRADLVLGDGDPLETGIEIVAQPPGKKLQSLSLLSGGERALTAIALIFAMLRVKPAPFCVLDEIEAALDEVNVVRFARVLREFGETGQFIVVTHQKGTMTAADRLYGVTMEEQGVSRLVSVRLAHARDAAAGREPPVAARIAGN